MTLAKRIKYIGRHINKIGLYSSMLYFLQRLIKSKGALISVKIKGLPYPVYLRSKTYDSYIFYQIFIAEELEYSYAGPVKTILDLGGNIGLSTLFFLRKFPDSQIITVEPASNNIHCVSINSIREKYQLRHIDLLKMDIEGSEEACIVGANIDWLMDTTYFMVEIHDSLRPGLTTAIDSSIPSSFVRSKHGEYMMFHRRNNRVKSF